VVGVEVREEHRVEVGQADAREQLALRALAAVDQQPVAPAAISTAGRPRRAVGADPPVPANTIERSI